MTPLHLGNRGTLASSNRGVRPGRRRSASSTLRGVEVLEDRQLLSTFTVSNLDAQGAGSLRQAILQANGGAGPDTIEFAVAGTVRVGRSSLPAITDPVTIDGSSAPTFAGTPVVTVDYQGTKGLKFDAGADGSILRSLSLVRAGNAGVTLVASNVTVEGNTIGLRADGQVAGNRGDGVRIEAASHDNLIGRADPVTGVGYFNAAGVGLQPVSGWQGIREGDAGGQYLITGTSATVGLLYEGPISGVGGTSYAVKYPGATSTSVYGPDNLQGGVVRLVGSYKTGNDVVNGFLYEGTAAGLSKAENYRTIDYPGAKFTYVHSTMGGLAVGNADGPEGNLPIGTGHAFLYDVAQNKLLPDIVYPGSTSTTAYGIWSNGGTSYTICGGYTNLGDASGPVGKAYLVDYDSATGEYRNWTSFDYPNGPIGKDYETHFEGISSTESGVYTLSADSVQAGASNPSQGSWVTVRRNTDRSFGPAAWVDLNYPGVDPTTAITSSNSVSGNQVVGIVLGAGGGISFQATVNVGFRLSNVISGNGGNGIGVYGSRDNRISMNYIGTDATGTISRGNAKNGIFLTQGAARNLIGGQATNGNDPTAGVFARPPQGNLISGNKGSGVFINKGATRNVLSGNFIGTDASGNAPLGNRQDGVAIDGADGNQLLGCTFQQSPFVFYNVLSGNGGNGLRVHNSNDTTVQANFLGVGANNAAIVPNGGDGLLISGGSRNTLVGGVIPLGNVISGNDRNGIEVRDRASGFTSFNTFAGVFAFGGAAPNRRDGILITSTGGNNLIRTTIASGNLGNGIQLGGNATGVQVVDTAAGTNTVIGYAIPNGGSGLRLSGHAHGNTIGGFLPSVVPQVTLSGNRGYGIEFAGSAHDNTVFDTFVGTNYDGTVAIGNGLGGILLGGGTSSNVIGGAAPESRNKILNNGGNGLTLKSSRRNAIQGNEVSGSLGFGLYAEGNCAGTVVRANAISGNAAGDVNLTKSKGIDYTP